MAAEGEHQMEHVHAERNNNAQPQNNARPQEIVPEEDIAFGFTLRTSSQIAAVAGIIVSLVHAIALAYMLSCWYLFLLLGSISFLMVPLSTLLDIPLLHGIAVIATRIYSIVSILLGAVLLISSLTMNLSAAESAALPGKIDALWPTRSEVRMWACLVSLVAGGLTGYFSKIINRARIHYYQVSPEV